MPTNTKPAVPKGAKASGRKLWRAVIDAYELDEHEMALLRELVRIVDRLDALHAIIEREGLIVSGQGGPRAHPATVEARQLAIVQARITAALRLPEGEQHGRPQRRVGVRGVYHLRSAG